MKVYLVNSKYYTLTLDKAIEKAKEVLNDRINLEYKNKKFDYFIHQTKKGNFSVKLDTDEWWIVGNKNLLITNIRKIEIEDAGTSSHAE